MLFNSLQFLVFFPVVVTLYWLLPLKWRNPMLLVASYYFYMCWEPIYALLIALSSVTTWGCALLMSRPESKRKLWLTLCLVLNLGILFLYKYAGFFAVEVHRFLTLMHVDMSVPDFSLLLPVGISFYTFQAVGYTIDVYRGTVSAEKNLLRYALFVAFFPQLVAGPIERASNLLSQFSRPHAFNYSYLYEGGRLMMWGFFMKLCVAENVAPYVNAVYNNIEMHNGVSVWMATFFFTFQIFCDFGGYSLIAIGVARSMGFFLMDNFKQPYLSGNVKDFWRRWHISLSTWFGDYIYKPLGGSRCSTTKHQRNLLATFAVSGLWHGANWTFLLWGIYHGVLQVMLSLRRKFLPAFSLQASGSAAVRRVGRLAGIGVTFVVALFGWALFRANSLHDAKLAFCKMANPTGMLYNGEGKPAIVLPLLLIGLLMIRELRDAKGWRLSLTGNKNVVISGVSMALLLIIILMCARFEGGQFIYFQF